MKIGKLNIAFKPEFGNQSHLKVLKMAKDIQEKIDIYDKKVEAKRGTVALKKEISKEVRELKEYIKFLKTK